MSAIDHPHRATRREWLGLAVIALPCMVYAMDLTVLNLALPAISTALQPTGAQLLWIIDVYGFLVAGLLITMGTLGDRIGRRKVLMAGAALFAAASVMAALATSAEMLIAMRALLGIAGATVAPSTMSLIRNMFHHERERQFAIGVWIASYSVGAAIGPLVGGLLLQFFWWGSVLLVGVPVMVLVLLLGPALLPEYRDPGAGRLDPASVALSLATVLMVVYALKRIAEAGLAPLPLGVLLAGLAFGVAFARRQRQLAYPLLDLALFRQARFAAAIAAYGLSGLAMFGIYIFITQYLQLVLGLSALQAGLATLPWALGFVAGSLLAPRLARRVAPAAILFWGLLVAAAGMGALAFVGTGSGLVVLVLGTLVTSLGMAPVITVGNEMIITAAPPERAGAASALSETTAEFCGAMGIALFGSVGTALYRAALAGAMPAGVPADVAAQALATLGGAVAAAHGLGGPAGAALLQAARAAFVEATHAAALTAAAVAVATGLLSARILQGRGPVAERTAPDRP